jgi:cell division protein FtsL
MIKDSLGKIQQLLCQLITYIITYCFYIVFSKIRYFNVNLKMEKIFIKIQNSFPKYVEGLLIPC